jgi:hypothetical protein
MDNDTERYYPASLLKVYFNWCTANDEKAGFQHMHDFVSEIQGVMHVRGIDKHTAIGELLDAIDKVGNG